MSLRRRTRSITVLLALCSLLFMQLAVARYVCPASLGSGTQGGMVMTDGMPCAKSPPMAMDDVQPALCHAHCQAEKLSSDKYELPPPVALTAMPANYRLTVTIPEFSGAALQSPHLVQATAPPIAIRNCCFRI